MSARLGEEKISSLLTKLSLPATIGMMVNALYNIVDTIFIGRGVGADAIGGLAIAFPIQMVVMAFAFLIGIGGASVFSRSLGAKDVERAEKVAGNAVFSIIILSSIIIMIGLIFTEPLLYLFGATETLLPYAKDYISIIFIGSIFFSFTMTANNLVRAEGNAKVAALTMIVGTGLNIILDPIFIYGFKLGIKGAAYATIISQFISFIFILIYMYSGKSVLNVKLKDLEPDISIQKEIFAIGVSAFVRQVSGSLVAIVFNNSLRMYGGDNAITIMGIINRLIMFFFLPLFGVVQGMQPIVGFNYGAKKVDRIIETIKLSLVVTTTLAAISWLIAEIFPFGIVSIFTTNIAIIEDGGKVMRIILMFMPIIGIQIIGASLFQSIGKAIPSLILALLRQVIIFVPLILLLPLIFNDKLFAVWISFPIADVIATIITAIMLKNELKNIKISLIDDNIDENNMAKEPVA